VPKVQEAHVLSERVLRKVSRKFEYLTTIRGIFPLQVQFQLYPLQTAPVMIFPMFLTL
jgi:hypothetical protein